MTERPARWSPAAIGLHWLGAALILELLGHGWIMVHGGLGAATAFGLYQWHKTLGFAALAVTALRLLGRLAFAAPAAPLGPPWERRLASGVQAALYALTLAAILAGWLVASASPLPIPIRVFGLAIPDIARPDPALFAGAALAHKAAAWAIAALVALHVAGAAKHALLDRDGTLTRMAPRWPFGRRAARGSAGFKRAGEARK